MKAYRKGKILKAGKASCGYLQVELGVDKRKTHPLIHRLVAKAFISNPDNLPEVNHKDENKENNCVENLEWCNRGTNINYGSGIKRSANKRSKKVVMCDLNGNELEVFCSVNEASRQMNCSVGNISECCNGRRETASGFKWKYK